MVQKKSDNDSPLTKRLYLLAAVLVIIIGFRYIATDLIAPVLIAAMFAVLLIPIFNIFRRRGFSRGLSLTFMIITVFIAAFAIVYLLQYSFGLISENIEAALQQASAASESSTTPVNQFFQEIGNPLQTITPQMVTDFLSQLSSSISNLFLYLLVIPVLAIVLVAQLDSFSENFKAELLASGPSLSKYEKFSTSVRAYITGRFKVNLSTALLITPALILMGVEYAILWGFLTLILCFIPYLGIFIAGIGPFLIVISKYGVAGGVLLIIIYFIITSITENIIDPLVQGRENRLTTMSLIVGFIFWSWLFGIFGAIVSAPMTVMIKTIFEDYPETRWIAMLMVGDYSKAPKSSRDYKKVFGNLKKKIPKL